MIKSDIISVKCPACEGMVVNKVAISDLKAGRVILTCHYCGQQIPVRPPSSFFSTFLSNSLEPIKRAPDLIILSVVVALLYQYGAKFLRVDRWIINGVMILFIIGILIIMSRRIQRSLGKPRWSVRARGYTVKDAIPVHSVHEEYNILDLQRCPKCRGTVEIGTHSMVSTSRLRQFFAMFLGTELIKFCDQIVVKCSRCQIQWTRYFNIDQIPYVQEMGMTEEMMHTHLQLAIQEQDLRKKGFSSSL